MVATNVGDTRVDRVAHVQVRSELDETKASFQTTELWVFVAAVVGVWLTTQRLDNVQAWDGLRLITALAVAYMVSRGLAKSGSHHRDA